MGLPFDARSSASAKRDNKTEVFCSFARVFCSGARRLNSGAGRFGPGAGVRRSAGRVFCSCARVFCRFVRVLGSAKRRQKSCTRRARRRTRRRRESKECSDNARGVQPASTYTITPPPPRAGAGERGGSDKTRLASFEPAEVRGGGWKSCILFGRVRYDTNGNSIADAGCSLHTWQPRRS